MDIHKPKPWHGWREFLKEYLIIVVGVLTALGAEQGVEWLHWRHLAAEAEQDLAAGLRPNLLNAYNYLVIENCGKTRTAELAAALQRPGGDWRGDPMPSSAATRANHVFPQVYAFSGFVWSHEPWDTAVASGVLNHMPKDRVASYAEIYHIAEATRQIQSPENIVVSHLMPLAYDRKLDDAEKAHYLEIVSEVATVTEAFGNASRTMLRAAHRLGVDPPADQVAMIYKRQRDGRGDCVTEVKLPLEGPASASPTGS